jgi:CRISPR-associated endonuclease/helicase Cas3
VFPTRSLEGFCKAPVPKPILAMRDMNFRDAFRAATRFPEPYPYQCRIACGPGAGPDNIDSLRHGAPCRPQLINIPTGLGKTAAVVIAWLWNRVLYPESSHRNSWPRRLVYCLPMRTLVEQTRDSVKECLERLDLLWDDNGGHRGKVGLHILMGGEVDGNWDLYPEHEAILIGTQDMLLSRALNRGYGMSRYRWPMHFGLLNNDCLWVMDETQLMGVAVETSAQLEGFREDERLGSMTCPTWWMSATLAVSQLATVDHPEPCGGWLRVTLEEADRVIPSVHARFAARKANNQVPIKLQSDSKSSYARELAELIGQRHQHGTFTLVVLNRVRRAQEVYRHLRGLKRLIDPKRVALIHSRFRRTDRVKHEELLGGEADRIIIATQAVEAGVDISARLLITELAPWSSLVQRFGRCNRAGTMENAEVMWVDVEPKDEKDDLALPYSFASLKAARIELTNMLMSVRSPSRVSSCPSQRLSVR